MNRALALLLAALALLLPGTPVLAQSAAHSGARVVATVSWVEEWDPVRGEWVRIDENPASLAEPIMPDPVRFIARPSHMAEAEAGALAQYGPFRVLDDKRAALVGSTDVASPRAFKAMLAAHPGLEVIEFVDAPGTSNDIANLALGRAIRAAGLATYVPRGGSARSGAVELFLAGTRRSMDADALFAVHSWRDNAGREPRDFADDAPENRLYLDYYAEMGMSAGEAQAFYAMTNSVPHSGALWLRGDDMARWVAPRAPAVRMLDGPFDAAVRSALARSGDQFADMAHTSLGKLRASGLGHLVDLHPLIAGLSQDVAPAYGPAPRLAYAGLTAGLLDSVPAFP